MPASGQEKPEKEGESIAADINANLNSDRSNNPDSMPIIQSRNYDINNDKVNPINLEHTSRDFDLHGDILHEEATIGATVDSIGCHKNPSGPISKSPNNKTPVVKPGLESETAAKWIRITRPISSYEDVANNAQLGKRHTEAFSSEYPAAKRRLQKDEVPQSHFLLTMEAIQQPRRSQ